MSRDEASAILGPEPKLRAVTPTAKNALDREDALKRYIQNLSHNLLRAYLIDHLTDAHPHEVDKFVVLLKATGSVPTKEA